MRTRFRYFDTAAKPLMPKLKGTAHSEFLRTGRISRESRDWLADEKRYLTYEEVAERTELRLAAAGETTHERINSVHKRIRFPRVIFSHALNERPHLGYCHVTTAPATIGTKRTLWSFYMCNFTAEIGEDEEFFRRIRTDFGRMYFAVAIERDENGLTRLNRSLRDNGVLFRTSDPNEALKNVLMLGAPDETVREIIRKL
ncbi:DUF6656 family protein [Rhizobium helianthi]|uniref:DUF6656 family protein n=1 Tax=Rhizobium helianthi TaxID=1132695 RepID=A0ABW4M5C9_9HYPH